MKHSQKRIFMDIEKMTSDEFKAFYNGIVI